MEDLTVISRVLEGEAALFEILMRRHNQQIYRAVRSVLRNESEVEDIMQQAYIAAYTHLRQFNGTAKFSTWLTRIALNEAFARLRKHTPIVGAEGELAEMKDMKRDPESEAANAELREVLESTVDRLPENYRVVFMLREVEGLDTAETATALDVSEDVVKTRLHRAKEMLQQQLMEKMRSSKKDAFAFHATRCDRVVAGVLGSIPKPS